MLSPVRVWGQTFSEYRLTPIKEIGFVPSVVPISGEPHGTMGINNKGQTCYAYRPDPENQNDPLRAWAWLPAADYSIAAGFHDLFDLSDPETPSPSIARDINIFGLIVGESDSGDDKRASLWTLDDGVGFQTLSDDLSTAHAISDDETDVRIVGQNVAKDNPGCSAPSANVGMQWVLGVDSAELDGVGGYPWLQSVAHDVGPFESEVIVGISYFCDLAIDCVVGRNGTTWGPPDTISIGSVQSGAAIRYPFCYGTDDYGRIAGWARYRASQFAPCRETATYWEDKAADPVDLGLTMPADQEGDQSRAYAINLMGNPHVVGTNLTINTGVVWEYSGSAWSASDLNTLVGNYNTHWVIREAHDINDDGWIVAYARKLIPQEPPNDPLFEEWAVLLSPLDETCPEDFTGDDVVGTPDLLVIINNWGPCDDAVICFADLNNDGSVNTPDLTAVINAWGSCGESFMGGSGPPAWVQDIIDILNNSELTEEEQVELIAAILAEQE